MKILNRKNVVILVHVLCWLILAVGVLYYPPLTWGGVIPVAFWIKQTIVLVILMSVFYLNFYLLIPRLLIRHKVPVYIMATIALIVVVTLLNALVNSVFNLNDFFFKMPKRPREHHGHFDGFVLGMNLLMIANGIMVSFIQKWQQEVNLRQQLEQEKVTTELTLLKAQINPHFFFNTLNTIYSYTLSDGDVARTAITNLSKMMRYVLYDAAGPQTPLSKEIAFIREYVELMKLRISRKTTVLLEVSEQMTEVMIAPMLFLPFVENAFKHGVSSITEGQITIWILQDEKSLELIVRNTIYENRPASEEESNGIGIINTTRRLELLYPGKYTLRNGKINEAEYEAELKLFL
jgi:two-component system LytT family sensor kinase